MSDASAPRRRSILGPGLLVAATGVGAGDLATGAFTGSQLGTAVLWAVLVGAFLKFVLTEGLARWQIATGHTVLEGALLRLGRPVRWLFLLYLLPWSWFVGSALISASGATTHALVPAAFDDPATGKTVFGIALSLLGLTLVERGGYRLFEKMMRACVGIMFVAVVVTAVAVASDGRAILVGLTWPTIPDADGQGVGWTLALMGGVGGTLTILCYGYWLREEGRDGAEDLAACRLDLLVGYAVTAVFGVAMVVIGSTVEVEGRGAGLLVVLGDRLATSVGAGWSKVFLLGAWCAVFSSLVGVWQAVPYIFADFYGLTRRGDAATPGAAVDTRSKPYRVYLWGLALVPMLGLFFSFREVQKAYAVVGAAFMPLLAVALIVLNGRVAWVGVKYRNRWGTVVVLVGAVVMFVVVGFWL